MTTKKKAIEYLQESIHRNMVIYTIDYWDKTHAKAKFFVMDTERDQPINITYNIGKALGMRISKQGFLLVDNCYEVIHHLGRVLFDDGQSLKHYDI